MTSKYSQSTSAALKRKREELELESRTDSSLDRGCSGTTRIRELLNVNDIHESHLSGSQSSIAPRAARLLPSGDFVSLRATDISLIQDIFDPTNRKVISIPIEDCHIENLERGFSVSAGFGNTRDIIACFDEGKFDLEVKHEPVIKIMPILIAGATPIVTTNISVP